MKNLFTILCVVVSSTLMGQIVIDSADFGTIGDQVLYASDTASTVTVDPATGMAQTFNYTQLVPGQSGYVTFLDPTLQPEGTLYPNATSAISVFSGDVIYVNKNDTSMDIEGLFTDLLNGGSSVPLVFHPPVTMAKFPLNYTDTYSVTSIVDTTILDTFSAVFDSIRIKRNVQVTSVIDAFGTLNLPGFSGDVLRQYEVEIFTDSAWGLFLGMWQPITQLSTENHYYRFIAKNQKYYMLELQTDAMNNVVGVNFQPGSGVVAQIIIYNDAFCFGNNDGYAEAGAIGGTPPYSYLWSNGMTSHMATSLVSGNYEVTVTDATGDTSSIGVFVDEPDELVIAVDSIGPDINGGNTGYIYITPSGGTPIFLYNWSNGENNQNITNLSFGDYTLTITDNNNCTKVETFNVPTHTGVDELEQGFLMYPNPSPGQIQLEIDNVPWSLNVYSMSGALVASRDGVGSRVLDFSHLIKGMYVVAVNAQGKRSQMPLQIIK